MRLRARLCWFAWTLAAMTSCVATTGAFAAAPALPAVDGKWHHITSPHFELFSHIADRDSRDLLHNLEILRAVFMDRMKLDERLHVDVTVYAFRTRKEFQAYAPEMFRGQAGFAGFHLFNPDRAVICLAPAENDDAAQQVVFHEYVHHLFRIAEYNPPLWFDEGTADLLAGMEVQRDRVLIGTPLVDRALYLREESLLPLEQLFTAEQSSRAYADEKHTGVFYAESWALLHFWQFGESGFSPDAVARFVRVAGDREAAAGVDLRQYFRSCFGCDYDEMLRRLKRYISTGRYRTGAVPMPQLAPAKDYAARPVSVDEITLRLAELSVRVEHSPLGKFILLDAIKDHPNDPRPLETLGTEALAQQDESGAVERWEQARAAGSKNLAIMRELALMEGRRWFAQFDPYFRLPAETAERMRSRLLRSIEAEPAQGAGYEMLAWVEAFAEHPVPKNINLIIAHLPTMHDKRRTLIGLTMLMLRVERPADAAQMLDHLEKQKLSDADARAVAVLRERLNTKYPSQATPNPPTEKTNETSIAPPPAAPGLQAPSVTLPDDL